MMLGILNKDSGSIEWNGKPVKRENVNFGYLPEERGIYPKVKIGEQLVYFGKLKGMSKTEASEAVIRWCKKLKVYEFIDKRAEQLSKGNQQKIQFISALISHPELLVLDEPFSGLDPVNTELMKNVIEELIQENTYIVLSSHQMPVVEEYCRDILLLNKGKSLLKGNLAEIKKSYGRNNVSIVTNEDILSYLKPGMELVNKTVNTYEIKVESEDMANSLLKELVTNQIKIEKFEMKEPSLQEIFIEKVGGDQ